MVSPSTRRIVGGAVVLLVCCGPSAADAPFLRGDHSPLPGYGTDGGFVIDAGGVTIPPDPLEPWDTADAGPLTGIFAVQSTITARVGVTVELRQLFRLRIVQQGTSVHQKTTLCEMKLPAVPNVATLAIPPALQTLIQSKSVEVTGPYVTRGDGLGPYTPPPFLLVLGAQLANPATDPLPTMQAPDGSIDEDQDGNPGVTLGAQVLTCTSQQALYVAIRTTGTETGTVETPDVIDGMGDVDFAFTVLGYSDPCLSVASTISIAIEPGSPFRAERVGATEDIDGNGNVSCPELVLSAPALFGDYWSN